MRYGSVVGEGINRRSRNEENNVHDNPSSRFPFIHSFYLLYILSKPQSLLQPTKMQPSTFLIAAAAMLSSTTTAQTPPGYQPSSSSPLSVSYTNTTVTPGMALSLPASRSAPSLTFPPTASLVIMLDLDAPYADLNRTASPLCHWIKTPSSEPVAYLPPNPPAGSAPHRYVFLAYGLPANNGNGTFVLPEGFQDLNATVMERIVFDLEGFETAAGLVGPVGATWVSVAPPQNSTGPANGSAPGQFEGGAERGFSMSLVGIVGMVAMSAFMVL
ncbi:unnamed protein product [Periconia digitata]|uniref:PEBP-like protein n=1 Tax=Periconia digitata TaxID=1303443 RepID=A0A9W4UCZ1_9PLEO|nr:unnamed protein product [Periconia digitata]